MLSSTPVTHALHVKESCKAVSSESLAKFASVLDLDHRYYWHIHTWEPFAYVTDTLHAQCSRREAEP